MTKNRQKQTQTDSKRQKMTGTDQKIIIFYQKGNRPEMDRNRHKQTETDRNGQKGQKQT